MGKRLTLQQYNTLKAIHANNPQGKSFEEYLEVVCALKDLEYDPSIHEVVEPKVPLKEHMKRSKAGLGEKRPDTHKHKYKRTETILESGKTLVELVCKCGNKTVMDLI